jgi:hypothetical protein
MACMNVSCGSSFKFLAGALPPFLGAPAGAWAKIPNAITKAKTDSRLKVRIVVRLTPFRKWLREAASHLSNPYYDNRQQDVSHDIVYPEGMTVQIVGA